MGLRYLGGFETAVYNPLASNITSGTSTVQTQGVFTLKQQAQALANQQWVTDPNFKQTVLLLQADNAANGAQNNTFLDSSTANAGVGWTVTRNGNTTQGAFTPFSQAPGYWSNFFDGTDDYLSIADNVLLRFGAGAFTLEAWIYRRASGADHTIYAKGASTGLTGIVFQVASTNVLRFTHTTTNINSTGTIPANTWTHVAVVREGIGANQTKLYINGTQDGQGTVSTDFTQTDQVRIGTDRNLAADFNGYISNLRFVKGAALYTSTFTPSTTPLTTTSQGANATQVELLTCQNNQFLDSSSNAFAITANGTPSVQSFAPFAPRFQWTSAVIGGGGYFDGNGDYLTVANATPLQFGTGDFTINCWIYRNAAGAIHTIASKGTASTGWSWEVTAANVLQFTATTITTGSKTIPANTWTYVTVSRYFESAFAEYVIALYVNGAFDAQSNSESVTDFSQNNVLSIGTNRSTTNNFNGYMAGFEYIKGSSLLPTGTPTAPPVTISSPTIGNQSLLLNFTNAGIYDAAMDNVLETVGSAQVSTSIVKYGSGSMSFDGSGDYLFIPSTTTARFGSANWTIEFWFRTTLPTTRQIMVGWNAVVGAFAACNINFLANGKIGLQISETGSAWKYDDNSTGVGTALSANTWYHLAVTRNEQIVTVYVNGSAFGTYVLTAATTSLMGTTADTRNVVGISPDLTNQPFNGYIDDLRVTNGVARYYQNFIPPLVALPRQ